MKLNTYIISIYYYNQNEEQIHFVWTKYSAIYAIYNRFAKFRREGTLSYFKNLR